MGWASGSYLAVDLWDLIRKDIKKEKRKKLARKVFGMFEEHDADDWDYNSNLLRDAGLKINEETGDEEWV